MDEKKLPKTFSQKSWNNVIRERFFKDDEITEDSTSDEKILEKAIYDSIVTDGFKAVSVSKDHIYIVVD